MNLKQIKDADENIKSELAKEIGKPVTSLKDLVSNVVSQDYEYAIDEYDAKDPERVEGEKKVKDILSKISNSFEEQLKFWESHEDSLGSRRDDDSADAAYYLLKLAKTDGDVKKLGDWWNR